MVELREIETKATHTKIHDVIPANGTVVDDNVYRRNVSEQ